MTIIEVFSVKKYQRFFVFCLFLLEWPEPWGRNNVFDPQGGEGLNVKKKKKWGVQRQGEFFFFSTRFLLMGNS